jgi:hypothetical protein
MRARMNPEVAKRSHTRGRAGCVSGIWKIACGGAFYEALVHTYVVAKSCLKLLTNSHRAIGLNHPRDKFAESTEEDATICLASQRSY